MEARVAHRPPVTVTADASTIDQSLASAVAKLEKTLTSTFDRIDHAKGRSSFAGEES